MYIFPAFSHLSSKVDCGVNILTLHLISYVFSLYNAIADQLSRRNQQVLKSVASKGISHALNSCLVFKH